MKSSVPAREAAHRNGTTGRKAAILRAATEAFGQHGFKASSLRDVAAEAGVSLTLLNHHFGSKSMLLDAVVEAHHVVCRGALGPLRALLAPPTAGLRLDAFVRAWIGYEFSLYDTPGTAFYLRLLIRLNADPDVDAAMRARLHCARPLVLQALEALCPGCAASGRDTAWLLASGAIHAAILQARHLEEDADDVDASASDAARTAERFVVAGLLAYLNLPD